MNRRYFFQLLAGIIASPALPAASVPIITEASPHVMKIYVLMRGGAILAMDYDKRDFAAAETFTNEGREYIQIGGNTLALDQVVGLCSQPPRCF